MIRSFLAIPLPTSLQRYLGEMSIPILDTRDKINWVKAKNIHITLAFLGDTDEGNVDALTQDLQDLFGTCEPFEMEIDETGVYPHANDPKILWVGALPLSSHLMQLRQDLNKILAQHGYRVDNRKFQPHITLGRVKSISRKSSYIHDYLVTDVRATQFTVAAVNWIKSTLTPMGAEYEVIKIFQFKQGE